MDFLRNRLPGNFERYLQGIDFPIGKQELLRKLEHNGAPAVVLDQVGKRLPEGQYRSPQDLIKRPERLAKPTAAVREIEPRIHSHTSLLGSRHDLQRQSDPGPQPRAS
jgi:hypothetical protein